MLARTPAPGHAAELTVRGMLIGAAITVVFMSANIYMGLKTGITFSSSIPAAVISMLVLHVLGGSGILENNMVQTQASAAGTLCNVILVLPGLAMIGYWHGFPFWQTTAVCLLGGILGVMYSIPLRRIMVVEGDLPFPEGVAAAEVLHAGNGGAEGGGAKKSGGGGLRTLGVSGAVAALFSVCISGFRLLSDGAAVSFSAGQAVFRIGTGFSLALIGVGYLVGIAACLSLLLGVALAWGIAVPLLTWAAPAAHAGSADAFATAIWASQVRLIGAGIIAIGGLWMVATLIRPMIASIGGAMQARRGKAVDTLPRQDQDIPIGWVAFVSASLVVPLTALLGWFAAPATGHLGTWLFLTLIGGAAAFIVVFGFLMAAVCGYMAGLLGSSSSPISGIGILSTIVVSLLLSVVLGRLGVGGSGGHGEGGGGGGQRFAMAVALFVTSVIITVVSIANDNLQDLKTGRLVDATPWRQQVALLLGVGVGAIVIAPLLELFYRTYGFVGAMPHPGMDAGQAMAAPQASLLSAITVGIFDGKLPWRMVFIGVAVGVLLIGLDAWLRRRGAQLPVLTVGIGMYLPPTVGVTIAVGGVIGWLSERTLRRRAPTGDAEGPRRHGVLIASGFLVGESSAGVLLAAAHGLSRSGDPLALVGPGFATVATWLGLAGFLLAAILFYRSVVRAA